MNKRLCIIPGILVMTLGVVLVVLMAADSVAASVATPDPEIMQIAQRVDPPADDPFFIGRSAASVNRPSAPAGEWAWDSQWVAAPVVITDSGQLRMWYTGGGPNGYSLGEASSADGVSWTRSPLNPVIPGGIEAGVLQEGPADYKMWFHIDGSAIYRAVSSDGLDWTVDPSPAFEPSGVDGTFDRDGLEDPYVLLDGGGTYWMFYGGCNNDIGICQIGAATSPDGLTWTRVQTDPVLPAGGPGDWDQIHTIDPVVILDGATFKLWYSSYDSSNIRRIGYATSPDGINWTKHPANPVFEPDPGQWDDGAVGNQAVLFDGSQYHMWYSSNGRIGYVTSPDGTDWPRFLSEPVLLPGASLYVDVNYAHDWVEAFTVPYATLVITVSDAGGVKATLSGEANGDGWFGTHQWSWDPGQPDIAPGDTVEAEAAGLATTVDPVGSIEGTLDVDADTIEGSIHAPWLAPDLISGRCEVWVENGPDGIEFTDLDPDGGSYSCDFSSVGWDLQPGQSVAVRYIEPDGDTVINIFETPTIRVNYAHDWVEGEYEAGHTIWITLTNATGDVKATASGVSEPIPWWGDRSGFSTGYNLIWTPAQPDLQESDWVYATADDGRLDAAVQIGEITGDLDVNGDTVSGIVNAPWFTDPLQGDCSVWVDNGVGAGFTVDPDGGSYACDFADLGWDLLPGQDVGVGYREPAGNWVYNVLRDPAPELRVWAWGQGRPAAGGNTVLWVGYQNSGDLPDDGASITGVLQDGLTYLGDTSGLPHSGDGTPGSPLVWQLPAPFQPSSYQTRFEVFVQVDAAQDETVAADFEIGSNMAYYQSDQGARYSHWEDQVVAYTPDLSLGKSAWTGDPVPGSSFVYAVNVCNYNENAAGSLPVTLTDTLPLSTTLQDWWGQHLGWEVVSSGAHELVVTRPSAPGGWCGEVYLQVGLDADAWPDMPLLNTATVTTSGDVSPENNTATYEHAVGWPHENLTVRKDWVSGQFVSGGEINYSFNFSNQGNQPADQVVVTSTLPEHTSFVRASAGTPYGEVDYPPDVVTEDYLVWDAGPMANGAWQNVQVILQIDDDAPAGTLLTHTVEINRLPVEDRYDDNRITWVDPLNDYGPNLWVNKQNYQWEGEGRLWYEIRIANRGTTPLDDVWITDTYPEGTTLADWWVNHGPWITATEDIDNRQLAFWVDWLNPGETASVGFHLDVDGDLVGQQGLLFPNQVDAPLEGDVYPEDNYDQVTAMTGPDVFIEKWLTQGEPKPGEQITFRVRFGNANQSPWDSNWSYGSHITETLPAGMTFITSTWITDDPWVPELVDGNTIVWGAWTMWSNSSYEFNLTVQLDEDVQGGEVLINTIKAYGDSPTDVEPNWENNVFELPVTVLAPAFEVSKTFQSSQVAGMPLRYDLSLANVGSLPATDVVLVDTLPEAVTFGGSDGSFAAGEVSWDIASLDAGATITGWITGSLTCQTGIEVVNQEYGVASSAEGVTAMDGAPVGFTTLAPDIQATFQASAVAVRPGQVVVFTATATTDGTPLSYAWDFGDEATGNGSTAEHAYSAPGSYPVQLLVTDECGFTASYTLTVLVNPSAVYLPLLPQTYTVGP